MLRTTSTSMIALFASISASALLQYTNAFHLSPRLYQPHSSLYIASSPSASPLTFRRSGVIISSSFNAVYSYRNDSSFTPTSFPSVSSNDDDKEAPLGSITLVGAGPGDPDLLTMAALRALSENPEALIIADRLIAPEILALIKGELRIARKYPGCAEQAQQEIYAWTHEAINQGRNIVRLKIGDPYLFGRGGEEMIEFRKYGVEPKVIPGVSSAFSAPLLASIPVTHRNVANQVYICTGYGKDGSKPYLAPYYQNQTAVFLMAVGRLGELCDNLRQVGYPETTPVAIVEKASTPQQRTLVGNVRTIAKIAEEQKAAAPAVIVVGEVVNVLLEDPDAKNLDALLDMPMLNEEEEKKPSQLQKQEKEGRVWGMRRQLVGTFGGACSGRRRRGLFGAIKSFLLQRK